MTTEQEIVQQLKDELVREQASLDSLLVSHGWEAPEWTLRKTEKKIARLTEALRRHGVVLDAHGRIV